MGKWVQPDDRSRKTLAVLMLALMIAICNTGAMAAETPTPGPTPTPIPATPVASPIQRPEPTATAVAGFANDQAVLAEIVWARVIDPETNQPTRIATAFLTTDETIYATIAVARLQAGVEITANWLFDGTPVPALTTGVKVDHEIRDGWIEFHLTKPDSEIWPIGRYEIRIVVDGTDALSAAVDVRVPPA